MSSKSKPTDTSKASRSPNSCLTCALSRCSFMHTDSLPPSENGHRHNPYFVKTQDVASSTSSKSQSSNQNISSSNTSPRSCLACALSSLNFMDTNAMPISENSHHHSPHFVKKKDQDTIATLSVPPFRIPLRERHQLVDSSTIPNKSNLKSLLNSKNCNLDDKHQASSSNINDENRVVKYVCQHPGCEAAFTMPSYLKQHSRKHSEHRPFECDFQGCKQRFKSKENLKRHEIIHTNADKIRCKYCEKEYGRKDNLSKHMKHHHPNEE